MKNEIIIIFFIAILGAVVAVNLMSGTVYKLSAFEVELAVQISGNNFTQVNFPPIGKVVANTHSYPLNLKATVLNVNPDRLRSLVKQIEDKEEFINVIERRGRDILQFFILRTLLIAFMGGVVGVFMLGRREFKYLLVGGLIGLILLVILFAGTYSTYNLDRFDDPNYKGMLSAAPWMIGLIEEGLNNIDQLGKEMAKITTNISNLFTEVEALKTLREVSGQIKVLHVSDIHNNPVALDIVEKAINSFDVDLIIDSGDISDYGTPLEAKLLERIDNLKIPYLFVPGNHDSPIIIEKMKSFDNVIVLEAGTVKVKGLTVTGLADPASITKNIKPPKVDMIKEYQDGLKELLGKLATAPDLVVIHNILIATPVVGKVPVLLHGHDHEFKIREEKRTVIADAGTTGAAGIRGLQSENGIPYTLNLLHFNNKDGIQLKAIDTITIYSRESSFILKRKGISKEEQLISN
ncbi:MULTISPECIES: metallophosphoesterase family protein [unclassified Candidatus Frackibacter]|uniref:metallophosphoesterase family protein n=1 Tax=unclassified Candidatus Frackibacter TaxID=2648818 RepID=UPI00088E82A1|nr:MULTISPECIES: metallophosphoesterase [unclassified Candidatus Frackibacter]SDC50633.1 Calcineurin-like phosphoesterase superfamily domain-containing protein [Candidatus Frackibacter sp. WG11]SEM40428.1 Calcineurin-like phosphoesterase superfamily domain-containing protein [Candidatus Frackibacter sp. WG12]SFL74826.1 Calcineurin-like phosphoesterase superfamily domain-containing protein [Candidatus Frackibacter sp. WG13]